jgi:hypothetical protein
MKNDVSSHHTQAAIRFVSKVANLKKRGEPDKEGKPFEPSDGIDDSHSCLMDLIDDARDIQKDIEKKFTVVCLYPISNTEDFGADIYVNTATGENGYDAAAVVQRMASEANDGDIQPEDFRVIAVMAGEITFELDATNFP